MALENLKIISLILIFNIQNTNGNGGFIFSRHNEYKSIQKLILNSIVGCFDTRC